MSRPGIREVASVAEVAIGTVSNFLNHPERVSEAKSRRIREAIDTLGFVPSSAGRQLRMGVSTLLGYLVPDVSNPHFAEIAESIERRADERGLSVLIANSHRSREREDAYLRLFEQHQVRGIIAASHESLDARLAAVRERGTASVIVGQRAMDAPQPSVSVDDVAGGRLAVEHLVDRGRGRIAFVGGPLSVVQVEERLAGGSAAARAHGVAWEVIEVAERTLAVGRAVGEALVARAPQARPDAVFGANDLLALGVLQALVAAGITVPDEIAVVGFDDTEFAAASVIPLTSVSTRHAGFGEAVVDVLFDTISGRQPAQPHRVFAPELIVRGSTGDTEGAVA